MESDNRLSITFDNNCIIDIEQKGKPFAYLQELVCMGNNEKIHLRVVAIGASERMPGGYYAQNFAVFQEKIAATGLEKAEILPCIAYADITFLDRCLAANDEMVDLERKIHEILFPQIAFSYRDFCAKNDIDVNITPVNAKWRNAKCDVLGMWSHITFNDDIFVTSDSNFFKQTKRPDLIALGAKDILTPQDAVAKLASHMKHQS